MEKCLIVSREFYPTSNGSVNCLENILNQLQNSYSIDVVCYKQLHEKTKSKERFNGYTVHRIESKWDAPLKMRERVLYGFFSEVEKRNKMRIAVKPYMKRAYKWSAEKGIVSLTGWQSNAANIISEKLEMRSYQNIFALGAPFENIDIAYELSKKYNIPLYILQFDLFSQNPTLMPTDVKEREQRKEKEIQWYEQAAGVIFLREMASVLMESYASKFGKKFLAIDTPNLVKVKPSVNQHLQLDKSKINLAYCGLFYEDIRNPEKMLHMFEQLFELNSSIVLHIVGSGCEHIVQRYVGKWQNNIVFYGRKEKAFVQEMNVQADILVNLSNTTRNQAPSKIIEYIGMCKPIINFHSLKDDVCATILERYPVKQNVYTEQEVPLTALQHFITTSSNTRLEYANIEALYAAHTPANVAQQIMQFIK